MEQLIEREQHNHSKMKTKLTDLREGQNKSSTASPTVGSDVPPQNATQNKSVGAKASRQPPAMNSLTEMDEEEEEDDEGQEIYEDDQMHQDRD